MRINKLSIENFKCFKSADIELGKLTLLTGANSSGKSSMMYSILGALQSGEFPFQFSPNGKYVNMGDFREVSYKHNKDNIIKVGLSINNDEKNRPIELITWWKEDKVRKLPQLNKLILKTIFFNLEIIKKKKYVLNSEILHKEFFDDMIGWWDHAPPLKIMPLEPQARHLKKKSLTFDNLDDIEKLIKKIKDISLFSIISQIKPLLNEIACNVNFISSFRLHPERTYYERTETDLKVGKFGENYIDQIILWETQKAKEYKKLIGIMKDLSLLNSISSKRMAGGRFEIVVKVNEDSVPASLNDVGFGVSQFLPIVVADLQLPENSTLFVAQPEIHLHPSVQAQLGYYLIDQIKDANKNYIIETHSEYLLNRIRLAIVKKEISREDVKVYYFKEDEGEVITHKLEFTEDGQILGAPKDFFRTYMMDVMQIAMKVAE